MGLYLGSNKIAGNKLLEHPVGSVYITSNNTNPSTLFGGTWELFDKHFKAYQKTFTAEEDINKYFTVTDGTVLVEQFVIRRIGHSFHIRLEATTKKDLTDTAIQWGTINLIELGVKNLSYSQFGVMGGSDGGNAIINLTVYDDGRITSADVMVRGSDTALLPAGAEPRIYIKQEVFPSNMLDEYCDRFYWKRIS